MRKTTRLPSRLNMFVACPTSPAKWWTKRQELCFQWRLRLLLWYIGSHIVSNVITLPWRHNERDGVSNHWRLDCWLNRLSRHRSKKTLKFRITGLCWGNRPVNGGFPSQRAGNAKNISIWWRRNNTFCCCVEPPILGLLLYHWKNICNDVLEFIPCSVLILASDWLTTVKYRGVSHVWRHQREI